MENKHNKIDIPNFRLYESCTDSGLVELFIEQNRLEALYYLIMYRYKSDLVAVLGRHLTCYNNRSLHDALYDFFYYMSQPTERDKTNKLKNYNFSSPFKNFICTACKNYTFNMLQSESNDSAKKQEFDEEKDVLDNDEFYVSGKGLMIHGERISLENRRKNEYVKDLDLIQALETINLLNSRERYILLTYLYCERYKKVGIPLYLSRQISSVLGITEVAVKTMRSRLQKELRKKYKKEG